MLFVFGIPMQKELEHLLKPDQIDEAVRVIFPMNKDEVVSVVKLAHRMGEKLKTVSTGNNWGYHTFEKGEQWTLNLSRMRRILDFDRELGVVTLEPGVTQNDLKQFLDQNNLPFIVPTTGAGPNCSIMGNILERGYGASAYFDSFASCMSLEAVWPTGKLYRSPLLELGGAQVGKIYKWGVGPHLDGLFSQSNWGVVTLMNVVLKKKPDGVMGVFFDTNDMPSHLVPSLVKIVHLLGGVAGPIKITNHHRLLAIMEHSPSLRHLKSPLDDNALAVQFFETKKIPKWLGFFALYTDQTLLNPAKALIEKNLGDYVARLSFNQNIAHDLSSREQLFLDLVTGTPNDKALLMTHFRADKLAEENAPFLPERDGAGILWYAPLLPATKERVQDYLDYAYFAVSQYGFEPAITITTLSERCFDSVLALLFNSNDPKECQKAVDCWNLLFSLGQKRGIVPYRIPSYFHPLLADVIAKYKRELKQLPID